MRGAPTWRLARLASSTHHATPCADDTTASRGSRASHSDTAIFPSDPGSGGSVRCSATSSPAALHPLRHGLGRKAEAQMRVLLAQEFEIMRREIDDQQPALRAQRARGFGDRARAVVEEVQHLMDHHDVEGILRHRQLVDVALPHAAMLQPGALEPRAREREHVERHVDAEPALDVRPEQFEHAARCRCRDRAASGSAGRRARSAIALSTAASATCRRRMRSHSAACWLK